MTVEKSIFEALDAARASTPVWPLMLPASHTFWLIVETRDACAEFEWHFPAALAPEF